MSDTHTYWHSHTIDSCQRKLTRGQAGDRDCQEHPTGLFVQHTKTLFILWVRKKRVCAISSHKCISGVRNAFRQTLVEQYWEICMCGRSSFVTIVYAEKVTGRNNDEDSDSDKHWNWKRKRWGSVAMEVTYCTLQHPIVFAGGVIGFEMRDNRDVWESCRWWKEGKWAKPIIPNTAP